MVESIDDEASFLPSCENFTSINPVTELPHEIVGSFGNGENVFGLNSTDIYQINTESSKHPTAKF